MIEKGIVNIGELKVRLYIDPCEPEYLQFTIYECEEKQSEITDDMANMILTQALEQIGLSYD
jgi:hypothetical protein